MKKQIQMFCSILCLALWGLGTDVLTAPVRADDPIVISGRAYPKANRSSDFSQRLSSMPDWEPFVTAFTGACDKALGKELSREQLERRLPPSAAAQISTLVANGLSTRKGLEAFCSHVDAILFELQSDLDDDDVDENLKDILEFLQGKRKDLELDIDGFLAFVIDVNPRAWLSFLEHFRKDRDYRFLKNEPDGDFILRFDFDYRDREIEFCCAGLKLEGSNRYALIFSNKDDIVRYGEAFKAGRYANLDLSRPLVELSLEETFFKFVDRHQRRLGADSMGNDFFSKIKKVSVNFRDVDGVSRLELLGEMKSSEEARTMRDILAGFVALGQIQLEDKAQEKKLLQSIQIDVDGNKVSVALKLDNPLMWELLGKGLRIATAEIERRTP